jgi:putative NADH-flavin reductase
MTIALIGATGFIGSRLLKELSDRGHAVTAIARDTARVPALPGVTAKAGDIHDGPALTAILKGHAVVISSVHYLATDPDVLLSAVKAAGPERYLVVGGAGSLLVAPGARLVDQPGFPAEYRAEALKGAEYLERLKAEEDLDWTFLSPSAEIVPGERTGRFRLGGDEVLFAEDGTSRISAEDYAVALVDEIETPKHRRARFAVGY